MVDQRRGHKSFSRPFGPVIFDQNEQNKAENRNAVDPAGYTLGVNGNNSSSTGVPYRLFSHLTRWGQEIAKRRF
jgi:hypothetical protein